MGTVNPNDEPEAQRAAIGPAVTDPQIDPEPEPQDEDEDGDAEPKKKGGVKK